MRRDELEALLDATGLEELISDSRREFLLRVLSGVPAPTHEPDTQDPALRLAILIEGAALVSPSGVDRVALFGDAFMCRRAVEGAQGSPLDRLIHLFFLAADGIAAEKPAEASMFLRETDEDLLDIPTDIRWDEELLSRTLRSWILLSRRQAGWLDVREARSEIAALRSLQTAKEASFLETIGTEAAPTLLARYNLARIVDLAASYLVTGAPGDVLIRLDRHAANARRLQALAPEPEFLHILDVAHEAASSIVRGSIWFSTRTLGARVREFVSQLASEANDQPVLELWPSQRTAIARNLLDPAKRAVVVEMPTSSGKTLLAEFSVVQALTLDPEATVAYVVPTRALVNQTARRLRRDLNPLGYQVEAAVPVFELDPTEDVFLRQDVDVLIVTPEKLDLLVKSGHPSVAALSLVVVDEAHNIGGDSRGARLELLLGTLKRERADSRFLLLTPFVPNGAELAAWLGDEADAAIRIEWKPSERVAGTITFKKPRNRPRQLVLSTVPSVGNVDIEDRIDVELSEVSSDAPKSKEAITTAAALRFSERGGVLILAPGRKTAEVRAGQVAAALPERELTELSESIVHYAEAELGNDHYLPGYLRHGVTYHHAGLSHELRYLIETLIDGDEIKVVSGTTTLAQGVNFPIATVIVETLKKPLGGNTLGWQDLTYSEFWNIAGRAGRALRDQVGLVVFPSRKPADADAVDAFLRGEAQELASALLAALEEVDTLTAKFDMKFVRNNQTVSVFLQYLLHALRISGVDTAQAQIEDVLRSSLVFHQAREQDPDLAERLVDFARRYIANLEGKERGYLALADGTGFSLSSVDYLYAVQTDNYPEFRSPEFWAADNLLDSPDALTSVISVLSEIPELSLGRASFGVFDPGAVAGIVSDWITGANVSDIADRWFRDLADNDEGRQRLAGVYLYSELVGQVPWGMGALQRIALPDDALRLVGHTPSLVFYGVRTKEAATLRMAGVPRVAAEGLAGTLREKRDQPTSFGEVRDWLRDLPIQEWSDALPSGSRLTADECKGIWRVLAGADA